MSNYSKLKLIISLERFLLPLMDTQIIKGLQ